MPAHTHTTIVSTRVEQHTLKIFDLFKHGHKQLAQQDVLVYNNKVEINSAIKLMDGKDVSNSNLLNCGMKHSADRSTVCTYVVNHSHC